MTKAYNSGYCRIGTEITSDTYEKRVERVPLKLRIDPNLLRTPEELEAELQKKADLDAELLMYMSDLERIENE